MYKYSHFYLKYMYVGYESKSNVTIYPRSGANCDRSRGKLLQPTFDCRITGNTSKNFLIFKKKQNSLLTSCVWIKRDGLRFNKPENHSGPGLISALSIRHTHSEIRGLCTYYVIRAV